MRRRRRAFSQSTKRKIRRRGISLISMMFALIVANIIVIVVLGAYMFSVPQEIIAENLAPRLVGVRDNSPKTLPPLNNPKPSVSDEKRDDKISVQEVHDILDKFKDTDGFVRRSHILAFLLHNSVAISKRPFTHNMRTMTYISSFDYKNHTFNLAYGSSTSRSSHPRTEASISSTTRSSHPRTEASISSTSRSSHPRTEASISSTIRSSHPRTEASISSTIRSSHPRTEASISSTSTSSHSRTESSITSTSRSSRSRTIASISSTSRSSYPRTEASIISTSTSSHSRRTEASISSTSRSSHPRTEASISSTSTSSHSRTESSITSTSRSSHPRIKASKSNTSRSSHPRTEASISSTSRSSHPRIKASISSTSRSSHPRTEASISSTSRSSHPRTEASISSTSRSSHPRIKASISSTSRSPHPRIKASISNTSRSLHPRTEASISIFNYHPQQRVTTLHRELGRKGKNIISRTPHQEHTNSAQTRSAETLEGRLSSQAPVTENQHPHPFKAYSGKFKNGDVTIATKALPSCTSYTKDLARKIKPSMAVTSTNDLTAMFPMIQKGGHYNPLECQPKERTAIIIPYRNRYKHLHILLLNILPLLIKQKVEFTVFVLEQDLPGVFNRAMLFNVGFLEAIKRGKFDCFIFHDVDLVPINELNFYHCNPDPTHFVTGVDKFNYKLMYEDMFGGVVAFTRHQFRGVNGASNLYFGWGGEDDDLQKRVENKGYHIQRKYRTIGLYDMIRHSRDDTNRANPFRQEMLKSAKERQDIEGLNTAKYTTLSVELLPLYTWIRVKINMTEVLMTAPKYMDQVRNNVLSHFLGAQTNVTVL